MTSRRIETVHFIEDSEDEVFLTRLLFSKEKVDARLAHHFSWDAFRAALDATPATEPLLVCVDLNMPGMKGTEIISAMLAAAPRPRLISGICSGSEDPADRLHAERVGARFFVQKPLNRAALEAICSAVEELSCGSSPEGKFTLSCIS